MKHRIGLILTIATLAAFILGGCATPQYPIKLAQETLTPQSGKIGIAMGPIPKADTYYTHFVDGNCLLCLGVVSTTSGKLTAHTQTLSGEDLLKLKGELSSLLGEQGIQTQVIKETINIQALPDFKGKETNIAHKDFTTLRTKYNIDKLIVITINTLGFVRTYYAYFPTGEPQGALQGIGYMVDLASNRYEWYQPVTILRSAAGDWDEPPQFPSLTDAYFRAMEAGKKEFMKPFAPPETAPNNRAQ
jgi:hypothetical protein